VECGNILRDKSKNTTKIIYYDINGAVFLLPLQIRTYFIEMSREIRVIYYAQ